jgi:hypothetical protein
VDPRLPHHEALGYEGVPIAAELACEAHALSAHRPGRTCPHFEGEEATFVTPNQTTLFFDQIAGAFSCPNQIHPGVPHAGAGQCGPGSGLGCRLSRFAPSPPRSHPCSLPRSLSARES